MCYSLSKLCFIVYSSKHTQTIVFFYKTVSLYSISSCHKNVLLKVIKIIVVVVVIIKLLRAHWKKGATRK